MFRSQKFQLASSQSPFDMPIRLVCDVALSGGKQSQCPYGEVDIEVGRKQVFWIDRPFLLCASNMNFTIVISLVVAVHIRAAFIRALIKRCKFL
jgi:hypothetical protein